SPLPGVGSRYLDSVSFTSPSCVCATVELVPHVIGEDRGHCHAMGWTTQDDAQSSRHERSHVLREALHRGQELGKAMTPIEIDLEGVEAGLFPVASKILCNLRGCAVSRRSRGP